MSTSIETPSISEHEHVHDARQVLFEHQVQAQVSLACAQTPKPEQEHHKKQRALSKHPLRQMKSQFHIRI